MADFELRFKSDLAGVNRCEADEKYAYGNLVIVTR
jgi:hypothetical protein